MGAPLGLAGSLAIRAVQRLARNATAARTACTRAGAGAWRSMSRARRSNDLARGLAGHRVGRRWHHIIGSYDGDRVRLWIDGSQVGAGTPRHGRSSTPRQPRHLHRHLPRLVRPRLQRRDRRRHGVGRPPAGATTGPVDPPVADTPTHIAIARAAAPARGARCHQASHECLRVTSAVSTIPVRRKTKLRRRCAATGAVWPASASWSAARASPRRAAAHRPQGQDEDRRARAQGRAPEGHGPRPEGPLLGAHRPRPLGPRMAGCAHAHLRPGRLRGARRSRARRGG